MAGTAAAIAVAVFVVDQLTKIWVLYYSGMAGRMCVPSVKSCGSIEISQIFNLTMVWNRGISFGLLSEGLSTRIVAWVVIAALAGGVTWLLRWFGQRLPAMIVAGIAVVILLIDIALVLIDGLYSGVLVALSSRITLSLISLSVATGLVIALYRMRRPVLAIGVGLIIGGALGNAIDRMAYGAVVDFLNFSGLELFGFNFPWVFNVADAAINIGVACLLYDTFFASHRNDDKTEAKQVSAGQEDS